MIEPNNLQPIGPLQEVIQGTQLMAAKLDSSPLLCLKEQGVSCQGQILHIMPSDHLCLLTCSGHDSIPSQETKESQSNYDMDELQKYGNNRKILEDQLFLPILLFL